jgi:FkbM family methyltransferase
MYLLKEGSSNDKDPMFVTLPVPSASMNDKQLLFFPEKGVAKWFYESGMAEKSLIQWIYDTMISSDKAFVDIGAHVGTFTWTCGKKAAHTYSFECSPKTFCYLAANIALHELEYKVSLFNVALGNEEKPIDYIIRSEDGGGNGVKHLSTQDDHLRKIQIPMKTLDSFHLTNIGLIKIDVEGFEKEVLEGGLQMLRDNQYPPIIFESWGDYKEAEGVPARQIRMDLFRFLEGVGYQIQQIGGVQDMYLATYKRQ